MANWQSRANVSKQCSRTELPDFSGIQKGLTVRLCISLILLRLYENRQLRLNHYLHFILFCGVLLSESRFNSSPQKDFFFFAGLSIYQTSKSLLIAHDNSWLKFHHWFHSGKGRLIFCWISMGAAISITTVYAGNWTYIHCYTADQKKKKTYHLRKKYIIRIRGGISLGNVV